MRFVTNIPSERFNAFTSKHDKSHFAQSYEWGVFKAKSPDWDFDTVGLEDESNNLMAAALVLIRHLPAIRRPFLYVPRGFVLDFNNHELLANFTSHMYRYAKSKKAIFFKIDPDIKYIERDREGTPLPNGENNQKVVDHLTNIGYKHLGFTQDFDSTIQPRYTFRLDLSPSEKELLAGCHSKARYNIKVAEKKGIEIIEGRREDLPTFESIMKVTGQRDGFLTRPLVYFEDMYDTLSGKGMCKLYLAKLNPQQVQEKLNQELSETAALITQYERQLQNEELNEKKRQKIANKLKPEQNKLVNLEAQLADLQKLSENQLGEITMSGIITTHFGNKTWYLYGASDNLYRELMPNYLIQWHALTAAKTAGYEIYDLFGISGKTDESDPLYGLYRFKKGFGGEFTEFIGEFDYVVNPFWYFIWATLLPQFKNYRKKLQNRKTSKPTT